MEETEILSRDVAVRSFRVTDGVENLYPELFDALDDSPLLTEGASVLDDPFPELPLE